MRKGHLVTPGVRGMPTPARLLGAFLLRHSRSQYATGRGFEALGPTFWGSGASGTLECAEALKHQCSGFRSMVLATRKFRVFATLDVRCARQYISRFVRPESLITHPKTFAWLVCRLAGPRWYRWHRRNSSNIIAALDVLHTDELVAPLSSLPGMDTRKTVGFSRRLRVWIRCLAGGAYFKLALLRSRALSGKLSPTPSSRNRPLSGVILRTGAARSVPNRHDGRGLDCYVVIL